MFECPVRKTKVGKGLFDAWFLVLQIFYIRCHCKYPRTQSTIRHIRLPRVVLNYGAGQQLMSLWPITTADLRNLTGMTLMPIGHLKTIQLAAG